MISFCSITNEQYKNLEDNNELIDDRIYFITDEQEIRLNGIVYSPNLKNYVTLDDYNKNIYNVNTVINNNEFQQRESNDEYIEYIFETQDTP